MSEKKRKGTKDAWLVQDLDPLHSFMLMLLGKRTENEAVCQFEVEMSALEAYINEKNSDNPQCKYTFFHAVCAALFRTIEMRPCMNWFVRDGKFWERKEVSLSCIAKKSKADGAEEGLVIMKDNRDSEIGKTQYCHDAICGQVDDIRKASDEDAGDSTTKAMRKLLRLPKPILNTVMAVIRKMDRKGKLPKDMADANPYSTTCFISNLGSIRMGASYHHLAEFGSNSLFLIIGEKTRKPVFKEDGTYEMKDFLPLSLTIDERIADGMYFANSLKLFKALLLRPQFLDTPSCEQINKDALMDGLVL